MRRIEQPGPPAPQRVDGIESHGLRFEMNLQPGLPLLEAIRRSFAAAGFTSGVARIDGARLGPFAYVMPALSKTPEHAAFYSEIFRPAGVSTVETGCLTFGPRDGASFFHAHALWTEGDGKRSGGHIMPDETVLADAITLPAVGLDGAGFAAYLDAETNFKLFGPVACAPLGSTREGRFFALRVRPNIDLFDAIEGLCRRHGVTHATIHGGVGSTIGARFEDGRVVENFATEIAITSGRVVPGADGPEATIDVALVDYTGAMAQGRLKRGDNPVLMTFELVLEMG